MNESPEEIADLLTQSGLEVEGISRFEPVKGGLEGLVIGEVITCDKHPDADRLKVTTVDIGLNAPVPIVCGAPNVAAGQKVVVATVGATLYPSEGEPFKIKKSKIRGEVSEGMICAEDEIGLGESHDGIMVLDTDLPAGAPAATYFNIQSDTVLEIGLTPNRADAASHIGVARDLKALLKRELRLPDVSHFAIDNEDRPIKVTVENSTAAPRYSGITISGVTVGESPDWLKASLQAIGLAPINNVVDVTNFVLHELGQPLHAFDAAIVGEEVVVRTMEENTAFTTLDGKERKLSSEDLMICNAQEGMCIAGVFGGEKSGVTTKTTDIFLESAYFSPDYIRRTSQRHGLKTDASFRYERGTDPNITVYALKRAAMLIKEIAGGEISSPIVDIYPQEVKEFEVAVKYQHVKRLIGKEIPVLEIHDTLKWLDIRVEKNTEEGFTAYVPPYRVDVTREADIIEEILRIHGYDNIVLSDVLGTDYLAEFPKKNKDTFREAVSYLLASIGFYEIITNSLTKETYSTKVDFLSAAENVEILNKLSEDLGVLRQRLLFNGLEVIAHNVNRKQKNLKLFEFGKGYTKSGDQYVEKNYLALYLTGNVEEETWIRPARTADFHDLSSVVHKMLKKFRLPNSQTTVIHAEGFQYAIQLQVGDKVIGTWGQLTSSVSALAEVRQPVFYAEFDWDLLIKYTKGNLFYQEVSKFPEVERDLSLVIDKRVTFQEIESLALQTERNILKKINVFDVYQGDKIGEDKKAYALTFTLQDNNKTLTDKIIDKTMERLMQVYQDKIGAIIRK